uniref:Cellulase domain-containing protein n=1 Tax=Globodera pallida TaxID=36090 RepID=A0A183CH00_GLOPA
MGTQKSFGGYVANPSAEYAKMKTIIEAALDQGIYVIVDWHTGDDLATDEINYAVTWDAVVKPYSKTMIDLIRKYDKNNVIIVGTPNWDQDVDIVAKSPLTGYSNIAYSFHFYAGTHSDWLRTKAKTAYQLGLPMFVTEYGSYSANSNDVASNLKELALWYKLVDSQSMSYTAWHVADLNEQSSMLTSGVAINNICNPAYLTTYGKYIYDKLKSQNNGVSCRG